MKDNLNRMGTCPICKTRPKIRATCGDPVCQTTYHQQAMRENWKAKGKIYRAKGKAPVVV